MGTSAEEDGVDAELTEESLTTVSELNAAIADQIEAATDLYSKFIVGEVTDCGVSNGTLYFQLTDEDASIQCLAFQRYRSRIDVDIEDGLEIAVMGELKYYEEKGECSIYVHDAISIGEGAYQRKLEERREKLTEEGLFDDDRKQSLPVFPEKVGLITSAGSDAQEDTINTIHTRYPDVDVLVHGTTMQGDRAVGDIDVAIQTMDAIPDVDLLIVTRGGGSEEDLRTFNEEPVTRAIAETTKPTIVAIGHEMDQTLAGAAADKRAMTPTHAGETAVPKKAAYVSDMDEYRKTVRGAYNRVITEQLQTYRTRVSDAVQQLETAHEHEQEVTATQRRYRLALAGMVVLLVALVLAWWFL